MKKTCSKCNRSLPLTGYYFHKNNRRKDGWNTVCKQCCGSKYGEPRRYWSEDEDNMLITNFPHMSNQDLVDKFFPYRNVGQIAARARSLNLYKDDEYLYEMQVEKALKHLELIPDQKGSNSPCWNSKKTKCDFCGDEFYTTPYKLSINKNNFCSVECKGKFQSYTQVGVGNPNFGNTWDDIQREEARERAVKQLLDMDFKFEETYPEKATRELLENLNIKYEKEYDCKYYLIDFYLIDYGLMIEVQGNFFHCNPTMNIDNSRRSKILAKDKRKHTYIRNTYGIEVLYLWEEDLKTNIDLCEKLILEYVNNYGMLRDYHSYNYSLCLDKLMLNDNLVCIGY